MFKLTRILLLGGLLGKVLGILRELTSAWLFGTGAVASAYRLSQSAFLIPMNGPVSDMLNAGFTPRFSALHAENPARAETLFASLHLLLGALGVLVAAVLFIFAGFWVQILAPGFSPETAALARHMVQILALSMPAYVVFTLYAAADLSVGKGKLAATRATVQNIGLVAGTVLAWYLSEPLYIAAGFTLAYMGLAFVGYRKMRTAGLRFWTGSTELPEAKAVLKDVWLTFRVIFWVPVILQIHFVVERRVASLIDPQAVPALDYARFVSETVILLVAMPFGIAGLSAMAVMSAQFFRDTAKKSLRTLLLLGIPLSAMLAAHPEVIVQLLFARGAFDAHSVAVTTSILGGMGVGLWGLLVASAGIKFLNARGDNRTVLIFTVVATGVNIALNALALYWGGTRALGIASAANGVLFGSLVIWRLGLARELSRELSVLITAAILYVAAWLWAPQQAGQNIALIACVAVAFWAAVFLLVPYHRRAVREFISILRPAT